MGRWKVPEIEAHVLGRYARSEEDLDRVRAYIAANTRAQLVERLGVTRYAISVYERQYGVMAMRQCRGCERPIPMAQAQQIGGYFQCAGCAAVRVAREKSLQMHRHDGAMEFLITPPEAFAFARYRISTADSIQGWFRPQLVAQRWAA